MRNEEVWRGAQQVSEARGVTDLRSIVLVRRAFQVVPPLQENVQTEAYGDDDLCFAQVNGDEVDDDDLGGEEGLEKSAQDRVHIRMRRCFELVMSTGRIVRFEVMSLLTSSTPTPTDCIRPDLLVQDSDRMDQPPSRADSILEGTS